MRTRWVGRMDDGRIFVGESSIGTMSAVSQTSRVFDQDWLEAKGNKHPFL